MSKITIDNDIREENACEELENFPFDGLPVAHAERWEKEDNRWGCKVYLDDPDYDDTVPAFFTVWFEGNNIIDKEFRYL
jgi:hypothetical protein